MSNKYTRQARLKLNRPSLRERARPPKQRTSIGHTFTTANYSGVLVMQHCQQCGLVQYPSREICQNCLDGKLIWRETSTTGHILSSIELHHSLWEYFKRRLVDAPWPIATVKLDNGATVFSHLYLASFREKSLENLTKGTDVQVFSHSDSSLNSVLIAVCATCDIAQLKDRTTIAQAMGLTAAAIKPGGI
jgi:uncharacterized OB-fold protein